MSAHHNQEGLSGLEVTATHGGAEQSLVRAVTTTMPKVPHGVYLSHGLPFPCWYVVKSSAAEIDIKMLRCSSCAARVGLTICQHELNEPDSKALSWMHSTAVT